MYFIEFIAYVNNTLHTLPCSLPHVALYKQTKVEWGKEKGFFRDEQSSAAFSVTESSCKSTLEMYKKYLKTNEIE